MPTYTYYCSECDEVKERLVPMSKRDEVVCVICRTPMKRRIDMPVRTYGPSRKQ